MGGGGREWRGAVGMGRGWEGVERWGWGGMGGSSDGDGEGRGY